VVTEAKLKTTDQSCQITFIQCDHSAPRHVIRQAVVDNFLSSRLDIFIANAGILGVPPALTSDGYEVQFGTNYVSHAIMLKILKNVMSRTANEGGDVRLVMVSSVLHYLHPAGGILFEQLKTPDASVVDG